MSGFEDRMGKMAISNYSKMQGQPQKYMLQQKQQQQKQEQQQQQRMYINVSPAAVASRDGNIYTHGSSIYQAAARGRRPSPTQQQQQQQQQQPPRDKIPAIPKSQDVKKFIKEPSYSTILVPSQQQDTQSEALRRLQLLQQQQQQPLYVNFEVGAEGGGGIAIADENAYGSHYYPSPPSPVSSSYSELRQATRLPPGYYIQQMQKQQQQQQQQQQESLYEPIQQPQQINQLATGGGSEIYYKSTGSNFSDSSDYFGKCSQCLQRIVGEGSGCEAMGRRYHVECFTCHRCGCALQGRAFYALDGKPHCHDDYLATFERCCKCASPILQRILRATGKPYHPECFACCNCGKNLDNVQFTVDASNQIHCIPCFHQRFAPKCSVCKLPIMPEGGQEETVRVVALDRSFHLDCYRCEDCKVLLSSDEESGCYPLDGHVLCKGCNTRRIQALTSQINV